MPRKLNIVVLREDYLSICNNYIEAMILNQMIYYSDVIHDIDNYLDEELNNDINNENKHFYGWFSKSASSLNEDLMMGLTRQTIQKYINNLIAKNFIQSRENPNKSFKVALQYRVNLNEINKALNEKGYVLSNYTFKDDAISKYIHKDEITDDVKKFTTNCNIDCNYDVKPVTTDVKKITTENESRGKNFNSINNIYMDYNYIKNKNSRINSRIGEDKGFTDSETSTEEELKQDSLEKSKRILNRKPLPLTKRKLSTKETDIVILEKLKKNTINCATRARGDDEASDKEVVKESKRKRYLDAAIKKISTIYNIANEEHLSVIKNWLDVIYDKGIMSTNSARFNSVVTQLGDFYNNINWSELNKILFNCTLGAYVNLDWGKGKKTVNNTRQERSDMINYMGKHKDETLDEYNKRRLKEFKLSEDKSKELINKFKDGKVRGI